MEICYFYNNHPPPPSQCRCLHVLFPVTVFAEKSKYTEARQGKSTLRHRFRYFT